MKSKCKRSLRQDRIWCVDEPREDQEWGQGRRASRAESRSPQDQADGLASGVGLCRPWPVVWILHGKPGVRAGVVSRE